MGELTIFEQLDGVNDVLASIAEGFDADLYSGKQAQRIVCAAADIERFAITLKTLAMRRVDRTDEWKRDGFRSPQSWLAGKTGTTVADAYGTVELGEQLESLPHVAAAARKGQLSPGKTRMIASAACQDPDSEEQLLAAAKNGSMAALKSECAAARQRGAGPDAMARIHERRSFRDWTDADGAYRFEGTLTPDKGARFKTALEGFTDQVFRDARRAGVRERHEQYAADAIVRMADAAVANTTGNCGEVPKFTKSRVQVILFADAAAWTRGHTKPGETCEIVGIGPVDIVTARRMAGDAIIDIVLTHGIDVRTLAHAQHDVTRAQYVALLAQGYECNVDGCGNTHNLEIDHLGDGWAKNGRTSVEDVALKCGHCHDLKSYKGWTDGPLLPNGKRTLVPPAKPPPDG